MLRPIPGVGRRAALATVLSFACSLPTSAEETAPPLAAGDDKAAARSPLRRREYVGLWPFYSRETFEDGGSKTTSLFSAIRFERDGRGDTHHRVFPFYSASLTDGGTDHRLALLPLLYLRRRSPDADHDVLLPFFARWRAEPSRHTLLWPFFHVASEPETAPFDWIPTLFRHGSWRDPPDRRWRLGLPFLVDILHGSSGPEHLGFAAGVFFPFGEEVRGGFPLARWSQSPRGWDSHLVPLFAAGASRSTVDGVSQADHFYLLTPAVTYARWRDGRWGFALPPVLSGYMREEAGYRLEVLYPLIARGKGSTWDELRLLPVYWARDRWALEGEGAGVDVHDLERLRIYSIFYGSLERDSRRDHYFPPLLARYGDDTKDTSSFRFDLLYPLIHASSERQGETSETRVIPFFRHSRTADREILSAGIFLYRQHADFAEAEISRWAPFPLVHWKRGPWGSRTWALPLFIASERREQTVRSSALFIAPSFVSRTEEVRPPEADDWIETRRSIHVWPFFGTSKEGSAFEDLQESTVHTLFPFFRYVRRTGESDLSRPGGELHTPWPLVRTRWDRVSWDVRLLPLISAGQGPDSTHLRIYPALSGWWGAGSDPGILDATSILQWETRRDFQRIRLFPFLFSYRRDPEEVAVTGPLAWFHYRSSSTSGWFHLLPLGFGAWEEDEVRAAVFPFYYHHNRGSSDIDYWTPARFFFLWNTLRGDQETHVSFLWKAVEYTRGSDGGSDFRVFHRLFVNRDAHGQRELVVNPLFSYVRDDRQDRSSFSILHFVYSSETIGDEVKRRLFFIPLSW